MSSFVVEGGHKLRGEITPQGALLIHNHTGWRRPSLDMIEFEKKLYPMGILDGIEVMNQLDFYPRSIERAKEYGLCLTSNTDMHTSTYEYYRLNGALRNMTLIFAKDKSLESLKEAMKARRTLAYSFGTIAGEAQLLVDFLMLRYRLRKLLLMQAA